MPVPRIFVSSTCYDLQEIRYNLRDFIKGFNYEPVMSEFGDIFFDYKQHVQDSCINEIKKCQMYVLIIGNNYGSVYYKQESNSRSQDSITLKEFKESLELQLPKHIFINRFVNYDYKNYRRALNERLKKFFDENEVEENNVEQKKQEIIIEYNKKYPFPQRSYQHLFGFLDIIYEQKNNNAVYEFENGIDIQMQLKQQWAYYMFEKLNSQRDGIENKNNEKTQDEITKKIDSISELIRGVFNKPIDENGTIKVDIDKYINGISYSELREMKNSLDSIMDDILLHDVPYGYTDYYFSLDEEISNEETLKWLNSLDDLIKKYKWSKRINTSEVWKLLKVNYIDCPDFLDYEVLFKLNSIYKKIPPEEHEGFAESVRARINACVNNNNKILVDDGDMPF